MVSRRMRILFIYPNLGTGEIPLNLSYLTAIALDCGASVRIFDTSCYEQYSERGDAKQASVGQFLKTDINISLRKNDPVEELLTTVRRFKPDLVCATAFTNNYALGLSLLKEIKKVFAIKTMFGGVHTTLVPDEVIAEDSVDMICVGEGEGLIKDICNNMDFRFIKNLWYKHDGKVFRNEIRELVDLDTLPIQNFDGYEDYNFYRPLAGKMYRSASVEISRGCPYKCSYCVNHAFQKMYGGLGKYHRVQSVGIAIKNLMNLKDKYQVELFRFWDEDFTTLTLSYLKEFSKAYIKYINVPFLIYARVDTISEEKVKILKKMGCITIAMGIESGSQRVRKEVLNRHMTDEKIVESFKLVRKYKIRCSAYNMIGLPYEDREDIFKTIELNRKCKPNSSSIAFLEPYKNTKIFDICVDGGFIEPNYMATFDFFHPHLDSKAISKQELVGLLRTFMLYVKAPRVLWPLVRLCEQGNEFLYQLLLRFFRGK